MQLNVNDEVTSLLRYENKLQREITKELVHVRTCHTHQSLRTASSWAHLASAWGSSGDPNPLHPTHHNSDLARGSTPAVQIQI